MADAQSIVRINDVPSTIGVGENESTPGPGEATGALCRLTC
jgi:hypothetical protein